MKSVQRGQLGNITVELPVDAACGYTDDKVTVFCLDEDWKLNETQQLALLAATADPYVLTAQSNQAADEARFYLRNTKQIPENAEIRVLPASSCQGACERRFTVEWK